MNKILDKIEKKIGSPGITEKIVNSLSNSQLNSFLLELFSRKARKISPAKLLNDFSKNRFTIPSEFDPIKYKELEIEWLSSAKRSGYYPVQLSPLTPLGTSSVTALVDQNNVVSSIRGAEVISDATNVLALLISKESKKDNNKTLKYSAVHRHLRGQYFDNPNFTAHFGAFCMVTGGLDTGNFSFELQNFYEHIKFYFSNLSKKFSIEDLLLKIELGSNDNYNDKLKNKLNELNSRFKIEYSKKEIEYYQLSRFKIYFLQKGNEIDLCDGGFVDWSQKLLQNKKHRLMISGSGLEMIHKIQNKLIK